VKLERPRARRYPFVASIELTDLQSETRIRGQFSDLSLFGCRVETENLLPTGTTLMLRIIHAGANFIALGKVAYALHRMGMGIGFTEIEPSNQLVFEKWIEQLREAQSGTGERPGSS
jgi:PilZ domain-containing protein